MKIINEDISKSTNTSDIVVWYGIYEDKFLNLKNLILQLSRYNSSDDMMISILNNIKELLFFFYHKIDMNKYEDSYDICLILHDTILKKDLKNLSELQLKSILNSLNLLVSKNCTYEDCSNILKMLLNNNINWIKGDNNIYNTEG